MESHSVRRLAFPSKNKVVVVGPEITLGSILVQGFLLPIMEKAKRLGQNQDDLFIVFYPLYIFMSRP